MKFLKIILCLLTLKLQISYGSGTEKSISLCDRNKSVNNTFFRLPKTVKPIRYKLRFRSDNRKFVFYGNEIILVMINNKTDIIELNAVDLVIESAFFRTGKIKGISFSFIYNF
jgi:hypothetical protein